MGCSPSGTDQGGRVCLNASTAAVCFSEPALPVLQLKAGGALQGGTRRMTSAAGERQLALELSRPGQLTSTMQFLNSSQRKEGLKRLPSGAWGDRAQRGLITMNVRKGRLTFLIMFCMTSGFLATANVMTIGIVTYMLNLNTCTQAVSGERRAGHSSKLS